MNVTNGEFTPKRGAHKLAGPPKNSAKVAQIAP